MCVKPLQSPQHFCKTSQGAESGLQAKGPVPTAPEPPSLDQRQEQGSPPQSLAAALVSTQASLGPSLLFSS